MQYIFTNNAVSTLATGASLVATTLTVQTGHGSRFPAPGSGQGFVATIQNGAAYEIVLCTSRAGDVLTVQRAQDGTAAQTWASGSSVDLRVPKMVLDNFAQKDTTIPSAGGTMTGALLLDDSTSLTAPPLAFDGDANTGVAHPAADTLSLVTAGAERVRVTTTAHECMVTSLIPAGSAGAPGIAFTGDTDTGFFRPGADSLALVAGGVQIFTITSKGVEVAGNVGLSGDLTVSGDAAVDGSFLATAALEAKAEVLAGTFGKFGTTLESGTSTKVGTSLTVGTTATIGTPGTTGNEAVVYSQIAPTTGSTGQFKLPGGVIEKWGTGSTTAGTGTVTFGTAFPTACDNVVLTINNGGAPSVSGFGLPVVGNDLSATGFTVYGKTSESLTFFWRATGR